MIRSRRALVVLGASAFVISLFVLNAISQSIWSSAKGTSIGGGKNEASSQKSNSCEEEPSFKSSAQSGKTGLHLSSPESSPVQFVPGEVKLGGNYTKALVVGKTTAEDAGWIDHADLGNIQRMVYIVDDPYAPLHPPKNKGHEVMVYLSYIIDHYDQLPDVSIFMHAHQYAWHNNELLNNDAAEMVKRLSTERVIREGYMNLRCHWLPGCPDWLHPKEKQWNKEKMEQGDVARAWPELFPGKPLPDTLAQPCCAQFALSRERIRAIPIEDYIRYRKWITKTKLKDWLSGRVWEYLWHFVFTGQSVSCPNQWTCYCDGYGVCFESERAFDFWFELKWRKGEKEKELAEIMRQQRALDEYLHSWRKMFGLGGKNTQTPKPGADAKLWYEIRQIEQDMERRRVKAILRGVDPKLRAKSAGRNWKLGDGY